MASTAATNVGMEFPEGLAVGWRHLDDTPPPPLADSKAGAVHRAIEQHTLAQASVSARYAR